MNEIMEIRTWQFVIFALVFPVFGVCVYVYLIPFLEKWFAKFVKDMEKNNDNR